MRTSLATLILLMMTGAAWADYRVNYRHNWPIIDPAKTSKPTMLLKRRFSRIKRSPVPMPNSFVPQPTPLLPLSELPP